MYIGSIIHPKSIASVNLCPIAQSFYKNYLLKIKKVQILSNSTSPPLSLLRKLNVKACFRMRLKEKTKTK